MVQACAGRRVDEDRPRIAEAAADRMLPVEGSDRPAYPLCEFGPEDEFCELGGRTVVRIRAVGREPGADAGAPEHQCEQDGEEDGGAEIPAPAVDMRREVLHASHGRRRRKPPGHAGLTARQRLLVALAATCVAGLLGAAAGRSVAGAGQPLVRVETHLAPGATSSPHLLLMTLGGPIYWPS